MGPHPPGWPPRPLKVLFNDPLFTFFSEKISSLLRDWQMMNVVIDSHHAALRCARWKAFYNTEMWNNGKRASRTKRQYYLDALYYKSGTTESKLERRQIAKFNDTRTMCVRKYARLSCEKRFCKLSFPFFGAAVRLSNERRTKVKRVTSGQR